MSDQQESNVQNETTPSTTSQEEAPVTLPEVLKSTGYTFQPKRIGDGIVFYSASDSSFYKNVQVQNPLFTLWILSGSDGGLSYANKRFIEEGILQGVEVKVVSVSKFNMTMSQQGLRNLYYNGQLVNEENMPDAVLPRLGANVSNAGLAVIRQLQAMDLLVLNEINSIELSRNKLYTMQVLASYNMPLPKTMICNVPINIDMVRKEFSFPVVLKRASGSQGKGVMLVQNESMLTDIADMLDNRSPLIFQEFIENSSGRDLRVFVVGGRVLGCMMRTANKGFKANVHQGGSVRNAKLNPALEWLSLECAKIIQLDMAGVDILIDKDTYKICEINASPGFEGFEKATNVNVAKQVLEFVKLRLGLWRKGKKSGKSFAVSVPVAAEHEK